MTNNNGTSSGPTATTVTLNDDKSEITGDVATTIQWEVTVSNGSYQFGADSKYLYCINSNNGVRVGKNEENTFTIYVNDGVDFLVNTATSRYVGVYNSQDWRCYTSINANIKNCVTAFYKKTSVVDPSKTNVTLSFPEASYTADVTDGFSAPTLSKSADVTVVYSSTNEAVATVNETTGAVTLLKKGSTTIKATFAGDETYNSAEAEYTLTVTNRNANDGSLEKPFTVAEAIDVITAKEYGEGNYYVKGIISNVRSESVLSGGYLSYDISDDGTTENQLQVYKGKNLDDTEFTAVTDIEVGDNVTVVGPLLFYSDKTPEINTGNYIYATDHKTRQDAEIVVTDDILMYPTDTKALADLYYTDSDGEVTVTSSNEEVAKIEGDKLVAVGVGEAVITVSVAKTDTYKAASETFNVTVENKGALKPEGEGAGANFVKVTATEDITDGDYLIVYEGDDTHAAVAFNGGLETLDAANNTIDVTIKDGIIAANDAAKAATFTWNSTAKTLTSKSGLVIGNGSYANALKTGNFTNTVEIDGDENVVISAVESKDGTDITTLRYNYANNQERFRYYKSGQQAITLYKYVESTSFDIAVGKAGWRTIVTAADATLPEGLKAYVVTATNSESATLTEVAAIKANTPYILQGAEGDYTLTIAEKVDAPAGNLLQISTESTANGVYVLANGGNGVGFYTWAGGQLGAGRVYLPNNAEGARDFLAFSFGEATAIKAVENAKQQGNAVYNLTGQRVAQPTRGLYIVNGKKVVLK